MSTTVSPVRNTTDRSPTTVAVTDSSPSTLGVSVAYKAVRVGTLDGYWRQVAVMTAQIILGMILLGIAAYLFLGFVLPVVLPMSR